MEGYKEVIIDVANLAYRYWWPVRHSVTSNGRDNSLERGLCTGLIGLRQRFPEARLVLARDGQPLGQKALQPAYKAQREARLIMGMDAMRFAGLAPAAATEYSIELRNVMGASLPLVRMRVNPLPFPYSPAGISAAFDELRIKWIEAGTILGSWTEISVSVWRVAAELGRTQRRVKALENLLIPKYQAAIRRIQVILDEHERESFTRTKRIKEQRER